MAELVPLRVLNHDGIPDAANAVGAIDSSAGGDTYKNNSDTHLLILNTGVSACVVTVTGVTDPNGRTGNTVITVPAGETGYISPQPALLYGQTANITYDQVVGVRTLAFILE